MPLSRKDHRQAVLVGGGNDFLIANGPARLNYSGRACSCHGIETVAEWEKRIRRGH